MKNQNKDKSSKKLKIIKIVLFLLISISVLYFIYIFITKRIRELKALEFSDKYKTEFVESNDSSRYSTERPYNLLIMIGQNEGQKDQIDGFLVIQLNTETTTATTVTLNPNLYFESQVYMLEPDESRLVRIKDLFVVGELQTPPKKCSYAVYSIEELLAMDVDGYIWVNTDIYKEFLKFSNSDIPDDIYEDTGNYEEWSEKWSRYAVDFIRSISLWNIWRAKDVVPNIASNMDVVSVYSFIRDFRKVSLDDINMTSVTDDQVVEQVNNKGKMVDVITEAEVDRFLNGYLDDILMDREQARVEIFNGSMINGLGGRYKRWLDHVGADVIRVQNAPGEWEKTTVYVTKLEDFSYTVDKIIDLWGEDIKVIEGRPDFITTGDVIIVLGLDFSRY